MWYSRILASHADRMRTPFLKNGYAIASCNRMNAQCISHRGNNNMPPPATSRRMAYRFKYKYLRTNLLLLQSVVECVHDTLCLTLLVSLKQDRCALSVRLIVEVISGAEYTTCGTLNETNLLNA